MFKLFVVGVAEPYLSKYQAEHLSMCGHIFTTDRFHEFIPPNNGVIHSITPLSQTFETIRKLLPSGNVAILASGDPLFYGIGKAVLKNFSSEQVSFLPALSAVQRASALFQLPWDDAKIVSLHGREHQHLPTLLLQSSKTILFTDGKNSPENIAGKILNYLRLINANELAAAAEILVAEDIGLESQKIFRGNLESCSRTQFSPLNIMCILLPQNIGPSYRYGLQEADITHSRGLITKNEVRAATVHQLQLPNTGVLWDIGAGSGSISIESARSTPDLTVYAIDHKEEEITNIKSNIRRYGCFNIVPVSGKAPDCLATLPPPDRVFIGGSGGNLETIIQICGGHLRDGGKIVINGVIAKTIDAAPQLLADNNFNTSTSTIKVSRTTSTGENLDFNPITIISGNK